MDLPSLTHPEQLAWLLLLPVLWWLHRPPRPRHAVPTPYLALWRRAQERLRRRPRRLHRLRLWLLLLAAGAGVLALAGAQLGGHRGARALVVVLDVSASMAARDGDATAAERARARIEAQLAALPAAVEVGMLELGAGLRVLDAGLRGRRDWTEPAGAGRDWRALIDSLDQPDTAVWTLTDGFGPSPPPERGALTLLGAPAANLAITACKVRDAWPLPEIRIELEVAALGPAGMRAELVAQGGVAPLAPVALELAPGERRRVELTLARAGGGRVELALRGGGDPLPADDAVSVELPPPPPRDIGVLGGDEAESVPWVRFAAEALAAATGGTVVTEPEPAVRAGFLLVEGGIFAPPPGKLRCITFGTRRDDRPLAREDLLEHPLVVDWDRDHPLTEGLDLSDLRIRSALAAPVAAGEPLLRGEHGPLAVLHERDGAPSLHFQFRLADSNLPLLPAFPQLVRRAYARAFGVATAPAPAGLLSAAESELTRAGARPPDRPLLPFAEPGRSLLPELLLVAILALVLRLYV